MVRMRLDALVTAVEKNDDKAALNHGVALVGQLFIDLSRIATALEKIAAKG